MRFGKRRDKGGKADADITASGPGEGEWYSAAAAKKFVDQLLDAPSWARTVELISAHPELIEAAITLIREEIDRDLQAGVDMSEGRAGLLGYHFELLDRTTQVGVTRALAGFFPFKTDQGKGDDITWLKSLVAELASQATWQRRREFVEAHPFLLNGLGADVADLLGDETGSVLVRSAEHFLRDCKERGIAAASLRGAVGQMLSAPDYDAAIQFPSGYQLVLTSQADDVARELIDDMTDPADRTAARVQWKEVRRALAGGAKLDPEGTGKTVAALEFADRFDELAALRAPDEITAYLAAHPELATDAARQAIERWRRNNGGTYRLWWHWDRYARLLGWFEAGDAAAALESLGAADSYEGLVAGGAALAATAGELYLLHLAFPCLHPASGSFGGYVLVELAKGTGLDSDAHKKIAALAKFEAADQEAQNWRLPAAAWDGRRLTGPASDAVWKTVLPLIEPASRKEPSVLLRALTLLEVLVRIGTLEPPLARKVASLAATLHQEVSQTMPAREKAAAAARSADLTKLAQDP